MKAIMGFGFFLLFLAGIALVMLQGRQMVGQNLSGGGAGIAGRAWRPSVVAADNLPADTGMYVRFEVDGSIKGHGGCNSFSGNLEKTDAGIAVAQLGATRMACARKIMARESAFMQALQNTTQFEVGNDRLQLLGADNRLLAELVAAD